MLASLFLSPPPDMGGGIIMMLLGLAIGAAVLLFLGIVFVEALILILMDWRSILTALLDSFLVNLATTILGILLGLCGVVSLSPRMWATMWGISVAIEGVLLQIIRRQSAPKTWTASLITNIVSYIGLYSTVTALDLI